MKVQDLDQKIKAELEKSAKRYHIIGAWVAIICDPIFAITDFINIPNDYHKTLVIRLSIAVITFVALKFRKQLGIKTNVTLIFIPFILISLQNAYTFSLITNDNLLGHCLNYIALFIGGGMFILWNWRMSAISLGLSAVATEYFVHINPDIDYQSFLLNGGLLLIIVAGFMFVLIRARYNLTIKEIKARLELQQANEELSHQKKIVEDKNRQITSSIRYAQRIQSSLLAKHGIENEYFSNFFIFYKPKDLLSGDFYWAHYNKAKDVKIVIAADCTGHGIPGALTAVLGSTLLNDIIIQKGLVEPDTILEELNSAINQSFMVDQDKSLSINEGMDISILCFHKQQVIFSAAKNPLCIVRNSELIRVKGSKFSIGRSMYAEEKIFEKHSIELNPGDKFYIYSDGFQDQLSNVEDRKYYSTDFRDLLLETSNLSMKDQKNALNKEFRKWKGDTPQTDDVLVIGIQV